MKPDDGGDRARPARPRVPVRAWRRRGRKAQVSAVATILGLLLVVSFIANYLSTSLPQYMTVNDVSHDLLVENEVGRLSALLFQASNKSTLGLELSQPIVLGSAGLPPFAPPDRGAIAPAVGGSKETVKFGVTGTATGVIQASSAAASFFVQLYNTYAPLTQVAYDYGGVVFAQQDGIPAMLDAPPVTLHKGALHIWVPVFTTSVGTEGGIDTAILTVALSSFSTQTVPANGLTLASGGVTLTVTTPYSTAWMAYFQSNPSFVGDASCQPTGSSECSTTGTYAVGGPLGTVTLVVPASAITSVTLEVATFSIGLD